MSDKMCFPFATNSETLTDGSVVWYVMHADSDEKIASASTEVAVTDLVLTLNAACTDWANESPDHIVIEIE
ncbi:hypothetical protein [Massilia sp. DWR3-1-1]|uniref:hypothetical protein n=1 Tax=Massilia sp. DWR3-1-1 TaxID=2804559 RepID=UPI003CE84083